MPKACFQGTLAVALCAPPRQETPPQTERNTVACRHLKGMYEWQLLPQPARALLLCLQLLLSRAQPSWFASDSMWGRKVASRFCPTCWKTNVHLFIWLWSVAWFLKHSGGRRTLSSHLVLLNRKWGKGTYWDYHHEAQSHSAREPC